MIIYSRSNILLPNWILNQKDSLNESEFLKIVLEYLNRYPNYQFIKIENEFAVCDRVDEKKERRKKRG